MMRQSLLISTLIMGGTVTLAPKTLAQVIPVPFEGTVPGVCDATVIEPGILGYELLGPNLGGLISSGSGVLPFADPEALGASVDINCSSPASISVEYPEQVGGPPVGNPVTQDAVVSGGIPEILASQGTSAFLPTGLTFLHVAMFVEYDKPLVAGDYQFVVNLLIAPN